MLSMAEARLALAALAASCAGELEAVGVLRRLLGPTAPTGGSTARLKRENQNTAGFSRPRTPDPLSKTPSS
jgi:hypothetical protein